MHLLFVDESGTPPNLTKRKNNYFVIGGIVVPEGQWHKLRDALKGLKLRYGIRGEVKWRYFSPDNDDERNPMRRMNSTERNAIRDEIFRKIICGERSLRAIACVCCIDAAYEMGSVNNRDDLYEGTYKPVSERFQYYLQDLSRDVGRQEYGIIVADHRGREDDKRFRMHHEKLLHSSGEFISTYGNVVESLFLQPSHFSVGIQLADMIAGAVWRNFEKNDSTWFNLLLGTFRCSKAGVIDGYGLVKYPKSGWH